MDNKTGRTVDITFVAAMFVMALLYLVLRAPFRLDFKEQISIFLLGADRLDWYLSNPGVLAAIAGDWLTQFFIHPKTGAVLYVLLLLVTMWGLVRLFRLSAPDRPVCSWLLVIPVMTECYFITFPNYPVSATVGLALSVWTACGLALIKDYKISPVVYGITVPVMFVLAGGHALTLALLLGFLKRRDGIKNLLCILCGIVIMLVCGRLYNLTLLQTLVWPMHPDYINPPLALVVMQPLFILAAMILSLFYYKIKDSKWKSPVLSVLSIILIDLTAVLDNNSLESTIKIGTLAYHEQWKEVREMAAKDKNKKYNGYYWNLCNAREGRLADELLYGRWGRSSDVLFLSTAQGDPYFSMIYFTDALLEMGDVSQATDCALLAQTIMPGHYSTRMLRRLSEIAVVAGDYELARKYLNILMRTRNHKAWAKELLDCMDRDEIPQKYLDWRFKAATDDSFFTQGDVRSSLAIIASQHPYNRTAVDYLLCSYLLDKNVNTFISLYDKYYLNALDRIVTVPDIYQEALLVNVDSDESLVETVEKYRISQRTLDKFMALMEARARSNNPENLMIPEAMKSYWHYIMAVRFNTEKK